MVNKKTKVVEELTIFGSAINAFTAKTGRLLMRLGYNYIMYNPDGNRITADKPLPDGKDGCIKIEVEQSKTVDGKPEVEMYVIFENAITITLDGIDLEDIQKYHLCEQFLLSYYAAPSEKVALTHAYYMMEDGKDNWNIHNISNDTVYPAGADQRKISLFVNELNKAHRPNIKLDTTLQVCWNLHDKGEDCEYEDIDL